MAFPSKTFSQSWTTAVDKPSRDAPEKNWMEMIKELKAVNKDLEEKLAAVKIDKNSQDNAVKVLESEKIILKKLVDSLKTQNMEYKEEINDIAAVLTKEKDVKQKKETQLQKENILMEEIKTLTLEKSDLQKQLLQRDEKSEILCMKWENNLEAERANNARQRGRICQLETLLMNADNNSANQQEKINQLKAENNQLKQEEALSTCAICMDSRVQIVFGCTHAACNECFKRIRSCHICRKPVIQRYVRKITFS